MKESQVFLSKSAFEGASVTYRVLNVRELSAQDFGSLCEAVKREWNNRQRKPLRYPVLSAEEARKQGEKGGEE